jgi:hypothetical protein
VFQLFVAFGRGDGERFDPPSLDLWDRVRRLIAEQVDLSTYDVVRASPRSRAAS